MNANGYFNIVQASQKKLETYHLEAQTHRLLGAIQPLSKVRLRLAPWFHRVGRWLEAQPPSVDDQPLSRLRG